MKKTQGKLFGVLVGAGIGTVVFLFASATVYALFPIMRNGDMVMYLTWCGGVIGGVLGFFVPPTLATPPRRTN